MVREHFDKSFEAMREQSNRLAETERSADNFDEIVEQRVELDRLRDEVTNARKDIVSRFEPPAPDHVETPLGKQDTRVFSKIAATVSIALLFVAGFFAVRIISAFGEQFPLYYDDVVESLDTSTACVWQVDLVLRNDSDVAVRPELIKAVVNQEFVRGEPSFTPTIPARESAPMTLRFGLGPTSGCVASAEAISHGNLIIELDNDETVSRAL